ncbi:MAG: sensor histidine kinase [Bryobacteraceae bacterium]
MQFTEALLQNGPACHWLLDAEMNFVRRYGHCEELFPGGAVPDSWRERTGRAMEGEPSRWRETRGGRIYQIDLFPVPPSHVGGFAFEVTLWNAAEQRLRMAALDALRAQDAERARAARFLHDDVGQSLSAAGLQLDLLRMDLEASIPGIGGRTAEIQQVLEGVMQRVRDFSYELNPEVAERAGLHAALDRLAGRVRKTFPGALRLMADAPLRLPPEIATAFYRIAQEAVQNAVQHSGCTQIEVLVKSTAKGPALEIRDNGKGFDPGDPVNAARGVGILAMEQYAGQAGLKLSVRSAPQGTVVKAHYNSCDE